VSGVQRIWEGTTGTMRARAGKKKRVREGSLKGQNYCGKGGLKKLRGKKSMGRRAETKGKGSKRTGLFTWRRPGQKNCYSKTKGTGSTIRKGGGTIHALTLASGVREGPQLKRQERSVRREREGEPGGASVLRGEGEGRQRVWSTLHRLAGEPAAILSPGKGGTG